MSNKKPNQPKKRRISEAHRQAISRANKAHWQRRKEAELTQKIDRKMERALKPADNEKQHYIKHSERIFYVVLLAALTGLLIAIIIS